MKDTSYSGPTADEVAAMAKTAGLPVGPEVAMRVSASIGPGLQGFSPISGTLPFDLEPASFVIVQSGIGK